MDINMCICSASQTAALIIPTGAAAYILRLQPIIQYISARAAGIITKRIIKESSFG